MLTPTGRDGSDTEPDALARSSIAAAAGAHAGPQDPATTRLVIMQPANALLDNQVRVLPRHCRAAALGAQGYSARRGVLLFHGFVLKADTLRPQSQWLASLAGRPAEIDILHEAGMRAA
jgi:hypothetical protein